MDARELIGKDGWGVTACGLVQTPHRAYTPDHVCNPVDPEQVLACEEWIVSHGIPTRKATGYSYGLKHVVERWKGPYVSNGAFIQAALNLGILVEPEEMSWRSINAYIAIRAPKEPLR